MQKRPIPAGLNDVKGLAAEPVKETKTDEAKSAETETVVPNEIAAAVAALPETTENVTTGTGEAAQTQPKVAEEAEIFDPDAAIKEAEGLAEKERENRETMLAQAEAEDAQPSLFMFISTKPSLVVYVESGKQVMGPNGVPVRDHITIQFKNGVYKTDDQKIARKLRDQPACGKFYRESTNTDKTVLRQKLEATREKLRSGVIAGATSSSDGNDALHNAQEMAIDRKLANVGD